MHLKHIIIALACWLLPVLVVAQTSGKYLKTMSGAEGTVYFVPSLSFKAEGSKTRLELDFTHFRPASPNADADTVLVHGSLFSPQPVKVVEAFRFTFNDEKVAAATRSAANIMYIEQIKGRWHCRFNFTISLADFMALLAGENTGVSLLANGNALQYRAKKRWYKCAETVQPVLEIALK